MKTTFKTLAAATLISAAAFGTAHADPYGSGRFDNRPGWQQGGFRHHPLAGLQEINMRQDAQRTRINHGFQRGMITRGEFHRLMAEQNGIQAMERRYVADGFLHPSERADLNRRLDFAQQHIVFEARDRQRRF